MLKKTKAVLVTVPVVVVVVPMAIFWLTLRGPNPAQFEYLKDPQVRILPDRKVLEVQVKGEPEVVAGQAFGLLFKTYFQAQRRAQRTQPAGPAGPLASIAGHAQERVDRTVRDTRAGKHRLTTEPRGRRIGAACRT